MEYHVTAKQLEDAYRQQAGREPTKEVREVIAAMMNIIDNAYFTGLRDGRNQKP